MKGKGATCRAKTQMSNRSQAACIAQQQMSLASGESKPMEQRTTVSLQGGPSPFPASVQRLAEQCREHEYSLWSVWTLFSFCLIDETTQKPRT
jgi:hypothetical protein